MEFDSLDTEVCWQFAAVSAEAAFLHEKSSSTLKTMASAAAETEDELLLLEEVDLHCDAAPASWMVLRRLTRCIFCCPYVFLKERKDEVRALIEAT